MKKLLLIVVPVLLAGAFLLVNHSNAEAGHRSVQFSTSIEFFGSPLVRVLPENQASVYVVPYPEPRAVYILPGYPGDYRYYWREKYRRAYWRRGHDHERGCDHDRD